MSDRITNAELARLNERLIEKNRALKDDLEMLKADYDSLLAQYNAAIDDNTRLRLRCGELTDQVNTLTTVIDQVDEDQEIEMQQRTAALARNASLASYLD